MQDSSEEGQGELGRNKSLAQVEAALFIADEPLTARRLAAVAGLLDAAEARRLVGQLRDLYVQEGSAFGVEELAGGYQLLTKPAFHPWLARVQGTRANQQGSSGSSGSGARPASQKGLSRASHETLTIIAYRQPITRADIEAIRGVHSGEVINQLLDKGLIRTAGREDTLGRPMLYATTRKFLQLFGLKSLRDLPEAPDLSR